MMIRSSLQTLLILLSVYALPAAATVVELRAPTTGDGAHADYFGSSIHVDAEWLLVASYADVVPVTEIAAGVQTGTVQVYRLDPAGPQRVQQLQAPFPTSNALFGWAIQREGEWLAVAAPRYSGAEGGQEGGAVFLYRIQPEGMELERVLAPTTLGIFGGYGAAILMQDGVLWVGAPGRGAGGEVYRYALDTLQAPPVIIPAPMSGARFGQSLAFAGGQLAIGAPGQTRVWLYPQQPPYQALDEVQGPLSFGERMVADAHTLVVAAPAHGTGTVHRWTLEQGGWQVQPVLQPTAGQLGDQFGASLLLSGSSVWIGAPGTDRGTDYDVGAVYRTSTQGADPLPVYSQPADLTITATFGSSLALTADGTQVLVGAPLQRVEVPRGGEVRWFSGATLGTATASALRTLDRGSGAQLFRYAQGVAVSGSHLMVGAFLADTLAGDDTGLAYAYQAQALAPFWSAPSIVAPQDPRGDQRFGLALDVAGNEALVGAYWDRINDRPEQGSAYFFHHNGAQWVQLAKVSAPQGAERDNFGSAVALDGGWAAVGARLANGELVDSGNVHVYRQDANGQWSAHAILRPPVEQGGAFFGFAVAVCGSRVVVGAPGEDALPDGEDRGAVYVYRLGAFEPRLEAALVPPPDRESANLGFSVACSGDWVAAGAPGGGRVEFGGEVRVWKCPQQDSGCAAPAVLELGTAERGDLLGIAVAMHGRRLLAGLSGRDGPAGSDVGAAVLFEREAEIWSERSVLQASQPASLAGFGRAVDIDDQHMVIGSPTRAGVNPGEGEVQVVRVPALLLQDGFEAP